MSFPAVPPTRSANWEMHMTEISIPFDPKNFAPHLVITEKELT
jgi:hypothetical protein